MIRLFGTTDTDFSSNGDKVLIPLRAVINKEDNGSFNLDIDLGLEYVDVFLPNRIIVANTPQGNQAFRIGDVKKTKTKLTATCNHIFYDTKNYLIEDSYVVDKNCNDALDHLNSATSDTSPFTTLSDVNTINSYRCVRRSLFEALQVVVERWGGHIVRDNYTIKVLSSMGADNGVVVRYAKNLKDITCQEDWSNVVTKLMPVGQDGLLLPEKYLVSENQYDIPYTKKVSFNQYIDTEPYEDDEGNIDEEAYQQALIDDLRNQAQAYLDKNCYPLVNYTLDANLEKISHYVNT